MKKRRRFSGAIKIGLCYALSWGIAAAAPCFALRFLYPYKLAGTAPAVADGLTAFSAALAPVAEAAAMSARDSAWRGFVAISLGAAWLMSLAMQLVWRARFRRPKSVARATDRAARAYRLTLLIAALWNAAVALWLWVIGVRYIAGFGLWDALCYFGALPLNVLAVALCSRLAAPPALSGRRAYFRRL